MNNDLYDYTKYLIHSTFVKVQSGIRFDSQIKISNANFYKTYNLTISLF